MPRAACWSPSAPFSRWALNPDLLDEPTDEFPVDHVDENHDDTGDAHLCRWREVREHAQQNQLYEQQHAADFQSVDDRLRMIRHVDISVPEGMENTSATVSLSVAEERFGDTAPEDAVIAHHTGDGWQLLETRVESRGDGEVTLAAVTPGFSRFAVFATNRVEYRWQVEGEREVRTGQRIVPRFRELGRYQVNLTVEDAFGLTDDTVYEVLVDDVPRADVETVETHGRNRTATLRARVTNQVGDATVVWRFPDGSVRRVERDAGGDPGWSQKKTAEWSNFFC